VDTPPRRAGKPDPRVPDIAPPDAPPGAGKSRASGGEALMVLLLDDAVPGAALERIQATEGIFGVTSVVL
jgi:hypothetical protein